MVGSALETGDDRSAQIGVGLKSNLQDGTF
jgi:hypothetical protein